MKKLLTILTHAYAQKLIDHQIYFNLLKLKLGYEKCLKIAPSTSKKVDIKIKKRCF